MSQNAVKSIPADTPLLQEFPPLLRNRNFFLLMSGYVVSVVGDRVHFLVMLELLCMVVLKRHVESAQHAAQLNLAMFLPFLLLAPLGGAISDRLPRRWVMISCDLVRSIIVIIARTVLLVAAYHSSMSTPVLLVMLFGSEIILSCFGEIFSPARAAIVPNLVHPKELLQANSFLSVAGTISTLLGFILGGLLLKFGLDIAMYVDAGTYCLSAFAVFSMRMRPGMDRPEPVRGAQHNGLVKDLKLALGYLKVHKHPLQTILLELAFTTASAVILNCMPAIVTARFGLSNSDFAYFLGVAGIGMILGAALVSRARNGIPKEIGIGWSTVAIGFGLLMAAWAAHWETFLIWLTIAAMFGAIMFITADTLLQRVVPDYIRGRIMGARDLITTFGLLLPTVPIAFWRNVDAYIISIIIGTGVVITALGIGLLIIYYRRQPLPIGSAIARRLAAIYMELWHRWRRGNACRIPVTGPAIVAANHTSALDPLAVGIGSRRRIVRFLMARDYFKMPVMKHFFAAMGCIPVDDAATDVSNVRTVLRALKNGDVVGIFPEGGLGEDHTLRQGRHAVAMLALASGAPVIPVYVSGTNRHESVRGDFLRPARIVVYYGAPLTFNGLAEERKDPAVLEDVTQRIMMAIAALQARAGHVDAQADQRGAVTG
jgi:1-acyl-sn-glycerol-3-phosphate acyltransferase